MPNTLHRVYVWTLWILGIGITTLVGYGGLNYYSTPQSERATIVADLDSRISDIDVETELMKEGLGVLDLSESELATQRADMESELQYWKSWSTTGLYGHGIGIAGALMMMGGVTMYSSRKRIKRFRFTGKIKHFLEFHIFLCLLGPILVIFHSTFKFGGIVSVSLWSMIFVALSGIAGRYIYSRIPRTSEGDEVSLEELDRENAVLRMRLKTRFHIPEETLDSIDALGMDEASNKNSVFASLVALIRGDLTRRIKLRKVRILLEQTDIPKESIVPVVEMARKKALLMRKISFLGTARALFNYWHVIHIPFSIIMFLILIAHVVLTVSLGYTWIF
jgi:hypothetical protein